MKFLLQKVAQIPHAANLYKQTGAAWSIYMMTLFKICLADIRDNKDVHKMVSSSSKSCDYMWTPYIHQPELDLYISSNDGQKIGNLSWFGNEPSGRKHVAVYLSFGIPKLLTASVNEVFCVACKIPKVSIFTLWGVCKYSLLG